VLLPLNLTKTTKVASLHSAKIDERKLPELRVWQHVAVASLLASCFRHFAPIDFSMKIAHGKRATTKQKLQKK